MSSNKINWSEVKAAIWRSSKQTLRPVRNIDPVGLDQLLGIDEQKQRLVDNTRQFLSGQPVNNALLWGARGTGKSSLIKALLNAFYSEGLRIVEVDKADLVDLPDIVDELQDLPFYFVIYCDDLTFGANDDSYKALKCVMEGSIELPPANIVVYATSNRRHLMPEQAADNAETQIVNNELHHGDVVEETLSLSDRFGLWLSFYPVNWDEYFQMIDALFADYAGDRQQLHTAAKQFALARANHSGRTAKQFYLLNKSL